MGDVKWWKASIADKCAALRVFAPQKKGNYSVTSWNYIKNSNQSSLILDKYNHSNLIC